LAASVVPTPVLSKLFRPAFGVVPKTGGAQNRKTEANLVENG